MLLRVTRRGVIPLLKLYPHPRIVISLFVRGKKYPKYVFTRLLFFFSLHKSILRGVQSIQGIIGDPIAMRLLLCGDCSHAMGERIWFNVTLLENSRLPFHPVRKKSTLINERKPSTELLATDFSHSLRVVGFYLQSYKFRHLADVVLFVVICTELNSTLIHFFKRWQ